MGGSLWWDLFRRTMAKLGERRAYKCSRNESKSHSSENLGKWKSSEDGRSIDRQPDSSSSYCENGSTDKSNSYNPNQGNMVSPDPEGDQSYCRVHPIEPEQRSRLRVQELQRLGDWELKRGVFKRITKTWGTPKIDLFASRTAHQLETYSPSTRNLSWRPDSNCLAVDALTQTWDQTLVYTFHPFSLIGRCLDKIRRSKTTVVLVTLIWLNQPWYLVLLGMLTSNPRRIVMEEDTLSHPSMETPPPPHSKPNTASGSVEGFRKQQSPSSLIQAASTLIKQSKARGT